MSNPLISIIVPVYNAEPYIRMCVSSIIAQSFLNWELLLIDDGSSDSCGIICDEYAAIDKRVRVFHKHNGGVSSARNLGLEKASGQWVTFIDADDVVSPTYIEGLLEPTLHDKEIDFVQGGCSNYIKGSVTTIEQQYDNFISSDKGYVFNWFRGLIVSKLFDLRNIRQWSNGEGLKFDTQMQIAEDMAFTLDYLLTVRKYAFVPEVGYYYRRDNVCSATKNNRRIDYSNELRGWKHIFSSYSRYISMNSLDVHDIKYRQRITADMRMAILLKIREMPDPFSEKIRRIKEDMTDREVDLLSEASVTFTRCRIIEALKERKYLIVYFYIIMEKYDFYFHSLLNRLKNLICNRTDIMN